MRPLIVAIQALRYGAAISFVGGIGYGTWVFLSDVLLAKLSVTHAMVWGAAGIGAGIWLAFALLRGIGVIIGWLPEFQEAARLARTLEQMSTVADVHGLPVKAIVNIWYEQQPENKPARIARKTIMYGVLEKAISGGFIRVNRDGGDTLCHLGDTAKFFRSLRWKLIASGY